MRPDWETRIIERREELRVSSRCWKLPVVGQCHFSSASRAAALRAEAEALEDQAGYCPPESEDGEEH